MRLMPLVYPGGIPWCICLSCTREGYPGVYTPVPRVPRGFPGVYTLFLGPERSPWYIPPMVGRPVSLLVRVESRQTSPVSDTFEQKRQKEAVLCGVLRTSGKRRMLCFCSIFLSSSVRFEQNVPCLRLEAPWVPPPFPCRTLREERSEPGNITVSLLVTNPGPWPPNGEVSVRKVRMWTVRRCSKTEKRSENDGLFLPGMCKTGGFSSGLGTSSLSSGVYFPTRFPLPGG